MPTAVLMGMGLTPRLAQADEVGKTPKLAAGPCVTASDTPGEDAKADDAKADDEKAGDGKAGDAKTEDAKGGDEGGRAEPSVTPSATPSASAPAGGTADGGDGGESADKDEAADKGEDQDADEDAGSGDEAATPDPADSSSAPAETRRPGLLDPILDPLGDLLTGGRKDDEKPSADPSTSAPAPAPSTSAPAASEPGGDGGDGDGDDGDGGKGTGGSGTKTPEKESPGKKTAEAADPQDEDAGETPAGEDASASPEASQSPSPSPSLSVGADGEMAYPCPEEKKVAGTDEVAKTALPNKTWKLEATRLALHGLEYHGVVNLTRQNGEAVQVLKFTASGLDIDNLHQIVDGENGRDYHVQAAEGTESTFKDSTVTMYTEKLSGNLLGILPISFDAEHQPPLVLPELFFTDVEVLQVAQYGGTLTIPGMQVYTTPQ